jgi:pimeloyl-ACP methyl ester carboxylesterase
LLFETQSGELAGLVKHLDTWLRPEGGKFYAVGPSNGGVTAVRFGLDFPNRAAAVLAFPGAMPPGLSKSSVAKLKGVPLRMWVGAHDTTQWLDAARFMSESISKYKLDGTMVTVQADGHMIKSLTPEKIMEELSTIRAVNRGDADLSEPQRQVFAVLDELHDAAASALTVGPAAFDRYFACFAPDGVFIGTDATERWTVAQFKDYARPLFAVKKGWKYTLKPGSRHIAISADGRTAWFDELLENAKYGTCRGTGVLTRGTQTQPDGNAPAESEGKWLIAQYHLTMPVPNELAERVSKMIKAK